MHCLQILGSNAMVIEGGSDSATDTIVKRMGSVTDDILTITIPGGALSDDASLYVELLEETGIELQSVSRQRRKNAVYTGEGESGFLVRVVNATSLDKPLVAELMLNTNTLRKAGGCYTTETNTATICVPAYVGLYNYVENGNMWNAVTDIDADSIDLTSVTFTTSLATPLSTYHAFTALSSPQCCDYDGLARACGDQMCLKLGQLSTASSPGKLGDGTRSKMPSVSASTRPGTDTLSDLQDYQDKSSSGDVQYKMRTAWRRVCLRDTAGVCQESKTDWFSERFLHAVQAVSATRVLIFGGNPNPPCPCPLHVWTPLVWTPLALALYMFGPPLFGPPL